MNFVHNTFVIRKKKKESKKKPLSFLYSQLVFHPDRNSEQQAESNFILLRKAYDTLNDPVKRFAYDR